MMLDDRGRGALAYRADQGSDLVHEFAAGSGCIGPFDIAPKPLEGVAEQGDLLITKPRT